MKMGKDNDPKECNTLYNVALKFKQTLFKNFLNMLSVRIVILKHLKP